MNKKSQHDLVDEGSEDSFPASDPPSYMAGAAIAGAPPRNRTGEASSKELLDTGGAAPGSTPAETASTAELEGRKAARKGGR